jgi:sialate O-acetylesterase
MRKLAKVLLVSSLVATLSAMPCLAATEGKKAAGPVAQLAAPAEQDLRVANMFSNDMVLQREKPIRVWGWAKPSSRVTVTLTEDESEARVKAGGEAALARLVDPNEIQQAQRLSEQGKAKPVVRIAYVQENVPPAPSRQADVQAGKDDGYWQVELEALPASFTPKFLVVACGIERVACKNLLIGELWITAGQSNMAWTGARENIWEKQGLILSGLRYTTHSDTWYQPKADLAGHSTWLVCEDGKLDGISVIPYMFGKFVHRNLKVPVGIINVATGGSYGHNWASRAELDKIDLDVIKRMLSATDARVAPWATEQGRAKIMADAKAKFDAKLAEFNKQAEADKAAGKSPGRPPRFIEPGDSRAGGGPGFLFHGRVSSVSRLNIRGALFLQGEQESLAGAMWSQYEPIFPAIIRSFRAAFGQADLPFGIITLQGSGTKANTPEADAVSNGYQNVRDIHYRTHLATPNTGFICAADIGGGVHPDWKRPVAERAAYWALRDVYHAISPPRIRVRKVEFEGNKAYVYFERQAWRADGKTGKQDWAIDDQPVVPDTNDATEPDGFAVAGKDQRWYPTKVAVDPNRKCMVVWSDLVAGPVALRYGWGHFPHANIGEWYDPIPPFRTDTWPVLTVGLGSDEENKADRDRVFDIRNESVRQQMDREIRQSLRDIHTLELKLYGDPKRILASKVARTAAILDEMDAAYFGEEAKRLSAAALADICAQYYKPDGFYPKWMLNWEQAVRLDSLPEAMEKVLAQKELQSQLAAARASLANVRKELAKLPDPKPVTYKLAEPLIERAKKALEKKGIDWRRIVRNNTPITVEDLKAEK